MDKIDELKRQWAYAGKPKQWQDGFDAGMKELTEVLAERDARVKELEAELSRIKEGVSGLTPHYLNNGVDFHRGGLPDTDYFYRKTDLDRLMKGGE